MADISFYNDFLYKSFKSYRLSDETISNLLNKLSFFSFKKHQLIQDKGQIGSFLYIIEKGIARHYYSKEDKEFTTWFSKEGDFVANASFFTQKPVNEIIIALENIDAYALHYDDFEDLCNQNHEFERFVRKSLAEQLFLFDQYYAETFLFSASERYKNFIKQFPDLVLRIPLIYIASFLGMTPETLSRIRAIKK